jgi:murein DD-endopeptidase MepM/ murein hydrolase activator NlpD
VSSSIKLSVERRAYAFLNHIGFISALGVGCPERQVSHSSSLSESGSEVRTRAHTAAAVSHARHHHQRAEYTLVHAGRQVRIGPVAFWIVIGTLVIMGVWSIGTGTYFAFRESVLTGLMARNAQMQYAYEDRIAELRAQVDRITSRQLLDQEQFEQKLSLLLKRHAVLEHRTAALSGDALITGSVPATRADPPLRKKTSAVSDTIMFSAPADHEARLESREVRTGFANVRDQVQGAGLSGTLARVALSLDKIEQRQDKLLVETEERVDSTTRRVRSVLDDLGVDVKPVARGVGGPFVPLKAPESGESNFDRQLYRLSVARAQLIQYSQTLVTVPVRKPVAGEIDMSSPFGVRMDPFLHRPAMHTGLDMRGDTGDPVHATASGRVSMAGPEGGYGNMVEIEHGNGLATRYGHLSEIDVKVGQKVRIGEVIGRIGSTGRSTGPHLHYETRVDGDAVDPQKFLRAGVRLGGLI